MLYVNEHAERLDIAEALRLVSEQRRQQALRFKHEAGQRLSLAAYLLLRQGLKEQFGMDEPPVMDHGPDGKPFIVGHPEVHFNLSHSRHVAVCAIGSEEVGVDVECVRPLNERLARYVLSDAELDSVMAADDPARAFTRLWTMKESLLKLRGTGITNHMQHVLDGTAGEIVFQTTDGADYVCTVAQYTSEQRNNGIAE